MENKDKILTEEVAILQRRINDLYSQINNDTEIILHIIQEYTRHGIRTFVIDNNARTDELQLEINLFIIAYYNISPDDPGNEYDFTSSFYNNDETLVKINL